MKPMTVKRLKEKLNDFDNDEDIFMSTVTGLGIRITSINFIGYDEFKNLVIALDRNLIKGVKSV